MGNWQFNWFIIHTNVEKGAVFINIIIYLKQHVGMQKIGGSKKTVGSDICDVRSFPLIMHRSILVSLHINQ